MDARTSHERSNTFTGHRISALRWHYVLVTLGVLIASAKWTAGSASAQQPEWRKHLAYLAAGSGVWVTSNAQYRQPGEPPEYAMGYRLGAGGLAVTGCLWGRDAGQAPVFWQFFSAWDPLEKKVLVYQASPSGTVGIGHETFEDEVAVAEQIFVTPGGDRSRTLHRAVRVDADTYETTSFHHDGREWKPRRTYRWIRQPAGTASACTVA